MRNNEDRLSSSPSSDDSAALTEATKSTPSQGGLSFAVPTEFVELPSRGKLYPPEHPLHNEESVEIKFMTAKEEDILTSKALIRKGLAIDRMLESIIVNKNIKVDELILGDKNALIVAARISGYGSEYEISVQCPSCEEKVRHTFDLSKLEHSEQDFDSIGVEITENNTFKSSLYKLKNVVEFRLLTGKDELATLHEMEMKKKNKVKTMLDSNATSQLKRAVVSVDGITDRVQISRFIDNLPALDARYLRGLIKKVTPEVDMSQTFECASCGHEEEMEVPFTVEFFWPK